MAVDERTRPCNECGWPALAGTRRCPYCRARMPHTRRISPALWRSRSLRWIVLAWAGSTLGMAALALLVMGPLLAVAVVATALAPPICFALFQLVLHRRSAARIRALGRSRRASRKGLESPADPGPPERRNSSRDAGLR